MPTPAPFSQPVNLISFSTVEGFLAGAPFASCSASGWQNDQLIHLLTPFEGSQTVLEKLGRTPR